jgi:hypothetical protein
MSERELQQSVTDLCRHYRLLHYHGYESRRSEPGFPDSVIAGPAGQLFRELKSETGKLSPEQVKWKYVLLAGGADWAVWRPADLLSGEIRRQLESVAGRVGHLAEGM